MAIHEEILEKCDDCEGCHGYVKKKDSNANLKVLHNEVAAVAEDESTAAPFSGPSLADCSYRSARAKSELGHVRKVNMKKGISYAQGHTAAAPL
jgi:hypothetical protein